MDDKIKASIYISQQVKRDAQIKCIENKTSLSAAIEDLLRLWVAGKAEIPEQQP